MAQTGLPNSHWHTLLIHHRLIAVPESMESATRNLQPLKQRVQFSFTNYIGIPRRPVLRREEKTELIRSPLADVLPQVLDQLRRDLAQAISLKRLHCLNPPVPYALCDLDSTLVEQKISDRKRADLAGTDSGLT
jgi:hypothetical protein